MIRIFACVLIRMLPLAVRKPCRVERSRSDRAIGWWMDERRALLLVLRVHTHGQGLRVFVRYTCRRLAVGRRDVCIPEVSGLPSSLQLFKISVGLQRNFKESSKHHIW